MNASVDYDAISDWDAARGAYLDARLETPVRDLFERWAGLNSLALCVAQYWSDEADDAVHGLLVPSRFERPLLGAGLRSGHGEDEADPNLPADRPTAQDDPVFAAHFSDDLFFHLWSVTRAMDTNGAAIPHWAAYCAEGAGQEDSYVDVYRPVVLWQRRGGGVTRTLVGVQIRPWLDGVRASWDDE